MTPHTARVKTVYRRILKNYFDWFHLNRHTYAQKCTEVRDAFEAKRDLTDPGHIELAVREAEDHALRTLSGEPYRGTLGTYRVLVSAFLPSSRLSLLSGANREHNHSTPPPHPSHPSSFNPNSPASPRRQHVRPQRSLPPRVHQEPSSPDHPVNGRYLFRAQVGFSASSGLDNQRASVTATRSVVCCAGCFLTMPVSAGQPKGSFLPCRELQALHRAVPHWVLLPETDDTARTAACFIANGDVCSSGWSGHGSCPRMYVVQCGSGGRLPCLVPVLYLLPLPLSPQECAGEVDLVCGGPRGLLHRLPARRARFACRLENAFIFNKSSIQNPQTHETTEHVS